MADFINTIDVLGDDAVIDSIIDRTITEFKDNTITLVGNQAFGYCTALETVDLPNVQYLYNQAFLNCTSLKSVNLPELLSAYPNSYATSFFFKCTSLERIVLPKLVVVPNYMFCDCSALKIVDLPVATSIGGWSFERDSSLIAVILRNTGTVAGINANHKIATTAYVYVPRALVDSYKAATNWSNIASQLRALEDYTVDGTTTGELDETKI